MTACWTIWKRTDARSPYVHWFTRRQPGEQQLGDIRSAREPDELVLAPYALPARSKSRGTQAPGLSGHGLPVPGFSLNPGMVSGEVPGWMPPAAELPGGMDRAGKPVIDDDTVIVGVIDNGIPLGHRRWRDAAGKTRVLGAWQMLGDWSLAKQGWLPFGREVLAPELNRLLARYTACGTLDETALNTATGSLDMRHELGNRRLAQNASHGAHVLDAAAGADPQARAGSTEALVRDRVRILSVDMPSSGVFGASGTWLDDFLILAVRRVVDLADAIWEKCHPRGAAPGQMTGYPVVINMSWGKQAGVKDNSEPLAAWLHALRHDRKTRGLSPVDIVMPAGNDNLERCHAILEPLAGQTQSLGWRIQPCDQSSSFAEVWAGRGNDADKSRPDVLAWMEAPGRPAAPPCAPPGDCMAYTDLTEQGRILARLYSEVVTDASGAERRRFVLCTPPSLRLDDTALPTAPAGLWRIMVANNDARQVQCTLAIQTDQALQPTRRRNRRFWPSRQAPPKR